MLFGPVNVLFWAQLGLVAMLALLPVQAVGALSIVVTVVFSPDCTVEPVTAMPRMYGISPGQ